MGRGFQGFLRSVHDGTLGDGILTHGAKGLVWLGSSRIVDIAILFVDKKEYPFWIWCATACRWPYRALEMTDLEVHCFAVRCLTVLESIPLRIEDGSESI